MRRREEKHGLRLVKKRKGTGGVSWTAKGRVGYVAGSRSGRKGRRYPNELRELEISARGYRKGTLQLGISLNCDREFPSRLKQN